MSTISFPSSFTSRFHQGALRFAAWSAALMLGACGGQHAPPASLPDRTAAKVTTASAEAARAGVAYYTVRPLKEHAFASSKSINAAGQVVGSDRVSHRAFLYSGGVLRDLGTLGDNSWAYAINEHGTVIGGYYVDGKFWERRTFMYDGSTMRDIGTLGGVSADAAAINAAGQVVGGSLLSDNGTAHAFLYSGGVMRDLGTLGGKQSNAQAINATGLVVGLAQRSDGYNHAFLHDGVRMRDLGTLGGNESEAYSINAGGQVAGISQTAGGAYRTYHAFLHDGATMRDLGTLGGTSSLASRITDSGLVLGSSDLPGDLARHAFVYDGCTMRDLGTLGGLHSHGAAINTAGEVVGISTTADGTYRPFFWSAAEGRMVDLNTRLRDAPAGLVLDTAVAISERGAIVAHAGDLLVLLEPVMDRGRGRLRPPRPRRC